MGEPLSEPIYYQNEQWAVTVYGIEEIPTTSGQIRATDIAEKRTNSKGEVEYYNLPLLMAGKEWVKIELFLDAFMRALDIHEEACRECPSLKLFIKTADKARALAKWAALPRVKST